MSRYTISDHTADEWREMARECRQRSADSFDRCDTDGFLSQWASDSLANTYRYLAELAEGSGDVQVITWPMMATPSGDWVPVPEWRWVKGNFRSSVRVWDGTNVHWWNPSQARKAATAQRNDEKKGFRWGQALAHVHVQTRSAGSFHLVNVLVTDTDSSESIVEVINTAHYMDD